MTTLTHSLVKIQTSAQSVPSVPSWFGEVTLLVHYLNQQKMLERISEHVRFARRRFGHDDVIDFVAVQIALRDQRRTDAGSLLRADEALGQRVYGTLRTRSPPSAFHPEPFSRRPGPGEWGEPADPVSPGSAGSSPDERATTRWPLGSAGQPLPGV